MRNYAIRDTTWKNKGHELDGIARIIQNKEKSFYIIGNKEEIEEFYKRTGRYIDQLAAFMISECCLTTLEGIPVILENEIPIKDCTVIICVARNRAEYEMERDRWKGKGIVENQSFFQGEIFSMVYDVYERNQIRIDRIEIFLTSRCTLNCEKCISYIPYFRMKTDTPLEQLKRDADILFGKVDYIYKLKLLGGEGLLYPHLIEYIDYLHDNYDEKIGTIRIGTNGTILPDREILEMCRRNRVTLDISDYSWAVPDRCKLYEVKELCDQHGVEVEIKRTGEQWLDLGFPNVVLDKKEEKTLREHFYGCAMFCRQFARGKMWFCCTNFAAVCAGLFPKNENDYFDFEADFSKKDLLEYEIGYSCLGYTTFCDVCGGCSEEINPRQVEVAKQMKQ